MPVILKMDFTDGTTETVRIPAEIWRRDNESVTKLLLCEKPLASVTLDPYLETADADLSDNTWPPQITETRIEATPGNRAPRGNAMRRAQRGN